MPPMPPMPPALTSYWHSVQTCSNAQRVIEDQDPWDRRHKGHWLLARSQRPMHSWQDLATFQDISSTFEYMAYHNVHRLGLPSQKHCMPSGVAQKAGHFEQLPSAYSIDLTHPSPRLSTWKKCPQFGSSVRRLPSCSDTTSVEWLHGKIYQNLLVLLQANRATALLSQMKTCQDRFTQKDKKSQTEMRQRQLWHTNWRSSTALICSNMFFACFLHLFYNMFQWIPMLLWCIRVPKSHLGQGLDVGLTTLRVAFASTRQRHDTPPLTGPTPSPPHALCERPRQSRHNANTGPTMAPQWPTEHDRGHIRRCLGGNTPCQVR